MASINSSISISASSLFTGTLSLNASVAEQINGDADVQTISIPAGQSAIVYGPSILADSSNTVYFYAQNPATNEAGLNVYIQQSSAVSASLLATLNQSDFMWVPLAVYGSDLMSSGLTITVTNLNNTKASNVNVFWGSRS
jgi:hypothetical protein